MTVDLAELKLGLSFGTVNGSRTKEEWWTGRGGESCVDDEGLNRATFL